MARIKYSPEEVDLLARLIKSEALGEGEQGMLLVGNVVINRVVANCDVFRNTRTITEVVYQKNAFSGVGTPLFNEPVNELLRQIALRCINGYRNEPATNALWFKNPGTNVACPEKFYGNLSGRFKQHCFYNPGLKLNCDL